MPDDKSEATRLEYAQSQGVYARPTSMLNQSGIHYVSGLGLVTLVAVFLLLRRGDPARVPLTTACGGTFVILVQWGILAASVLVRQTASHQTLSELSTFRSVLAGAVGGGMVFAVPYALTNIATSDWSSACAVLLPLCGYPIVVSFFLFQEHDPKAGTADAGTGASDRV